MSLNNSKIKIRQSNETTEPVIEFQLYVVVIVIICDLNLYKLRSQSVSAYLSIGGCLTNWYGPATLYQNKFCRKHETSL